MTRPYTLCLIVILMVFAVIKASREQINQDKQKVQNRGTARYHSNLMSELSDFTALTTRSPRGKSSRTKTTPNLEKNEAQIARESPLRSRSKLSRTTDSSAVTLRTNTRKSNVDNSRNHLKLYTLQEEITKNRHDDNKENMPESQIPKQQTASRRISSDMSSVWIDSAKLDHEVFTKSDYSRSRTGRKIYTNYNGKELKSQIIPLRKSAKENIGKNKSSINELEKKETQLEYPIVKKNASITNVSRVIDTKNTNNSNNRKAENIKERDVLPLNSENVLRASITPAIENSKDVNLLTSATISSINSSPRQNLRLIKEKVESNNIAESNTKKRKQFDRSKSRGISNAHNPEIINSESIPRRNSSRFADIVNKETNRRSSSARNRSNTKNVNSGSQSAYKLRNINTTEVKGNAANKNVDINSEININGQTKTRNLSNKEHTSEEKQKSKHDHKLKVTELKMDKQNVRTQPGNWSRTISNSDIITTIPKATIETTTVSSLNTQIATLSSISTMSKSLTTARVFSSTEQISRSNERKEDSRMKKLPKEDFFNHGLGFRGRKIEESSPIIADLKTTTSKSETQLRGNPGWTLKRRPNYVNQDIPSTTSAVNRNQTDEIILSNNLSRSTEVSLSNAKVLRRGTKRPKAKDKSNIISDITPKDVTRGNKTFNKSEAFDLPKKIESEENDNYPLAFRARLSQLKNSNLKLTEEKSTTRSRLQATKSSPANLFSERSKLNLDLARKLIKPELNIDENNFNEKIFPYPGKSQVKEISTVNEDRNIEKTTKTTIKFNDAHVSHGIANTQKEKSIRDRLKIFEARKSSKDQNIKDSFKSSIIKKNQRPSERMITSSSIEGTSMSSITKFNTMPRRITASHRGITSVEETTTMTIDTTRVRSLISQNTMPREQTLANIIKALDENIVTIKPLKQNETSIKIIKSDKQKRNNTKETAVTMGTTSITDASIESTNIYTTELPHEITLSPTVTTPSSMHSSVESKKIYPVYIPDAKKYDSSEDNNRKLMSNTNKNVFQPRYAKQQTPDKVAISMVTSMTVGPTSRYIKKKSGVFTPYDAVSKPLSTEATFIHTKHTEFRPRTATYRRHSEVSTNQLMTRQSTKPNKEVTADTITVTPKPTQYHAQVVTAKNRSKSSESLVNVKIDSSNNSIPLVNENSNGSNIFNPTKSAFFSKNTTLLEQLRSTVAPLLNTLNDKTPIFSRAYSNVNTGNSAPRITPNGSPPRFSARYKGAELLVKKPSLDQVIIPSITTSSTTVSTLIKVFPTKVPEDSEAIILSSWTNSATTSLNNFILNNIHINSLR